MKEFLTYILNQIATKPEEVKITETDESGMVTFLIEVADEDMGLVIGKEGRTIRSIRSLARAKAIKEGLRIRVELLDKQRDAQRAAQEEEEVVETEEIIEEETPEEE